MRSDNMVSKVEGLLEKCNGKIGCNRFNLFIWSFMNDFKELQDSSLFNGFDESELKIFIKICNNRLERSKTFLNDIAIVFGFDLAALSIVATIGERENMFNRFLPFSGYIIVATLFVILIILFVFLAHYRSQVHAWTAFKELALIKCSDEKESKIKGEEQNA